MHGLVMLACVTRYNICGHFRRTLALLGQHMMKYSLVTINSVKYGIFSFTQCFDYCYDL